MKNLIDRQAAIDELMDWVEKEEKKSWSTFKGLFHWAGIKAMIECLPSAQPELIEKAAYIRGFEQGRTQGMIDSQGEGSRTAGLATDAISRQAVYDALDNIKIPRNASWYQYYHQALTAVSKLPSVQQNLQPTCNQLATDAISRQAAIDAMCELMHHWFGGDPKDEIREIKRELGKLPSEQPATNCSEIPNASDVVSRKAVRAMVSAWAYDLMEQEDLNMALHDVDELPSVSAERQRGKKNEGNF